MTRPLGAPARSCGEEPLRILFCANPSYFQHVAVASVSLAENHPGCTIDIHLITCDRDAPAEERLRASVVRYAGLSLTIHDVPGLCLKRFFVDKHVTKECYLRILAPHVLPASIEHILYLDCDVVVADDLRPLWTTVLGHSVVAAAPDHFGQGRRGPLAIPEDCAYVNSGVLLLDLASWRRQDLSRRIFDYVERHGPALELYDQDAINAVLHGAIRVVERRWNVQTAMFRAVRRCFPEEFESIREACRRPAIIHFAGPDKPWLFRSRTARKRDYFRYLDKTAWRNAQPALTTTMQRVEYRADRLLSRAGIDYLQVLYQIRRGPAKVVRSVAGLWQHSLRTIAAIFGKAGSAWGSGG